MFFKSGKKTNTQRTINKKKNKSNLFDFTDKANADFSIVLKNVEECRKMKLTKRKKCNKIDIISKEKIKENNH